MRCHSVASSFLGYGHAGSSIEVLRGDWDYSVVWYYPIRIKILIQPLDPIPWIDAMYVVQTEMVLPSFIQILTL